jgi:NADH:ubiquinone oxidoreductase subunit E
MKTLNIDSRKAVCTRQRSVISLLSKHITISERKQSNRFSLLAMECAGHFCCGAALNWLLDKVDYSHIRAACLTQIYNSSGFCLLSKYLHRYHL